MNSDAPCAISPYALQLPRSIPEHSWPNPGQMCVRLCYVHGQRLHVYWPPWCGVPLATTLASAVFYAGPEKAEQFDTHPMAASVPPRMQRGNPSTCAPRWVVGLLWNAGSELLAGRWLRVSNALKGLKAARRLRYTLSVNLGDRHGGTMLH